MLNKLWMATIVVLCVGTAMAQSGRRSRGRTRDSDRPASVGDSSSRRGGSRNESFLRRIDANGNGQIDAEEVTGRQKEMVEGILSRWGVELKYPLVISQIVESASNSGREESGDTHSTLESKSPSGNSSSAPPTGGFDLSRPAEPALPGFGVSKASSNGGETKTSSDSKPSGASAESADAPSAPEDGKDPPVNSSSADSDLSKDSVKPSGPKSGRFLSPKERLGKRLPSWFLEKDRDGDGQVMMSEFSREFSLKTASEFDRHDLNRDGIITAAECLKGESRSTSSK